MCIRDRRCAIVSLNIGDYDSSEVSDALLTAYGISTRPGGHCAPLMHEALGTVEQEMCIRDRAYRRCLYIALLIKKLYLKEKGSIYIMKGG